MQLVPVSVIAGNSGRLYSIGSKAASNLMPDTVLDHHGFEVTDGMYTTSDGSLIAAGLGSPKSMYDVPSVPVKKKENTFLVIVLLYVSEYMNTSDRSSVGRLAFHMPSMPS